MIDDLSDTLIETSRELDNENLGSIKLTGDFGYLLVHGQEADKTRKFEKSLHTALDSMVDEQVWMDDERIKDSEGELSDQAIFNYFVRNMDDHMLAENFYAWLAEEMDVEYDMW